MSTSQPSLHVISVLSEKLTHVHDLFVKSTKIASFIGIACGFIYLFTYTSDAGIPFPLELSVLPVTLLVVGSVSIGGTFMVVAGMFFPAIAVEDMNGITNGYFKARDCTEHVVRTKLVRYALCTWVPMVLALTSMVLFFDFFSNEIWTKIAAAICLAVAVGWIFFTPRFVGVFLENRWQYLFNTCVQILLAVVGYIFMLTVLIAVLPDIEHWPVSGALLFILFIFSCIHAIISIPIIKGSASGLVLPPYFTRETVPSMRTALFLACFFTGMSIFMPQMNSKIGQAVLRAFHVGGGIPVAICLKTMPADRIAKIFHFGPDFCSARVAMLLDSGDRVYIGTSKAGSTLPSDPVYFRQDDIRQKIYLKEEKSKTHR